MTAPAVSTDTDHLISTSGSPATGTFTQNVVANQGYVILVSTTSTVSSITASNGDTVSKADAGQNPGNCSSEEWYCQSSNGGIGVTFTVRTAAADASFRCAFEVCTTKVQPVAGQAAHATGNTSPASVGPVTADATQLALTTFRYATSGVWGTWPPSGWTERNGVSSVSKYASRTPASSTPLTPSAPLTTVDQWSAVVVVYQVPGGSQSGSIAAAPAATVTVGGTHSGFGAIAAAPAGTVTVGGTHTEPGTIAVTTAATVAVGGTHTEQGTISVAAAATVTVGPSRTAAGAVAASPASTVTIGSGGVTATVTASPAGTVTISPSHTAPAVITASPAAAVAVAGTVTAIVTATVAAVAAAAVTVGVIPARDVDLDTHPLPSRWASTPSLGRWVSAPLPNRWTSTPLPEQEG